MYSPNRSTQTGRFTHSLKRSVWRISVLILSSFAFSFGVVTVVNAARLYAPVIAATKTDTFVGPNDGDGKADPGETIQYNVLVNNTGADPATGVNFTDTIDSNTSLVLGSVNVSPLANDDTYATIGNTLLEVGVTASGNPSVKVTGAAIDSLFDNDTEFLGDTFTLLSVESDTVAPFTTATESGGSVTVETDGNFSYTPPVGFSGADHFDYVITDDGAVGSGPLTGAGRVTINVNTQEVWYVNNDAAPGGLGRSTDPFDTLLEAQTASGPNDTIFVFHAGGDLTGQNAGIILKNGQRLLGEAVALEVPVSLIHQGVGGPNPTPLHAAGSRPHIGNAAGDGVTLSTVNIAGSFSGVEIRGLDISGTGAGTNAVDVTTGSTFSGSFELSDTVISAAGADGVDVNGGGSGTLTVNIHDNTVTATGNGIDIQRTAGNVNIIAFDDNVVNGATGGTGINIVGTGASVLFDTDPSTATYNAVTFGGTVIGASGAGNGVGAAGLVLNNVRGDLIFADLDIYTDNGAALSVTGTNSNFAASGTGTRVTVTTNTPVFVAVGGPALSTNQTNINIVPATFSSTNSATTGVSLVETSGTLTVPSGSSISNATGVDFFVDGNLVSTAAVSATYNGTITDDTGSLVQIVDVTGGSPTYAFTGAITDNNDGDGSGITLTNNDSAIIRFSGGLLLSTGSNAAFAATGGAVAVEVCDENPCNAGATGALVNTITTTTGVALNVANTTIGANDLEFRSISANGAANGIVLNATGSSGNLVVKGNGGSCTSAGTCTGGAIQNTTGDGISLTSTSGVSLTRLFVGGTGNHGINTSAVSGLTLISSYVTNAGNADNEYGLNLVNPAASSTVTIDGTTFNNAADNLVYATHTGAFTLNVSNSSSFSYPSSVSGTANSAILVEPSGAGAATVSIQNSTFTNIVSASAQIGSNTAGANGTHNFTFSNNTISVTLASRASGVVVSGQELTTTNITIDNNNFSGAGGNGVISLDTNDTAIIKGTASGNTLSNPPGIGIFVAVDEAGKSDVTLNNNTITNSGGDGIQTVNFGGAGVSTMDMTITNNQINGHSLNTAVNFVGGVSFTAFEDNSCIVLRGNSVTGTPAGATHCGGLSCVDYYLEEVGGVATMEEVPNTASTTANAAYVNSTNDAGPVTVFGTIDLTNGATCNVTGLGMLPNSNHILAQAQPETSSPVVAEAVSANLTAPKTSTVASGTAKLSKQARWAKAPSVALFGNTPNTGTSQMISAKLPAPLESGETVTVPAFTLPNGKSVTVIFQVTVNNPLPQNATKITNQGTVSGSNFSTVLTANGGTVNCEVGSETCTPIDLVDLSVSKSNDTSNTVVLGTDFSWQIQVSNVAASRDAIFTNGQVVLEDHLPSTVTYDSPNVAATGGVIGLPNCSITTNVLTCTAGAGGLTIPSGEGVAVAVIVHTTTAAPGPLVNPTGGICKVDPNTVFAEVSTANNSCSNTVTVTRPNTTVVSLTRTDSNPNNTSSVGWQIVFANPVSGVTASNFSVIQGGSVTGASIDSVGTAIQASEPDTTWNITVDTGTGDGTLGLNFVNDTGMNYAVTNTTFTGEVYTIDKTAPTVTNVSSDSNTGCLGSGPVYCNATDVVTIKVTFNEAVNVTGTPQLTLETGSTDAVVDYTGGSGTNTLTFDYTVVSGHNSLDLDYVNNTSLSLNGGDIEDLATNNATLTLPNPGASGSLSFNEDIVIDTIQPIMINSVTSSVANGTYGVGALIPISISYSETVNVTGTPQLTLETGTTDEVVNYSSGSGSITLTYNYTVQAGDMSSDLDYISANALSLNSGTIRDNAGNNAILTLPTPGAPFSLGATKDIVIDSRPPADLSITKTDGVTTATAGGTVTYTIVASNSGPNPVTGGTVADTFPASLTVNWTCVGAGGGTCTAGPVAGNINDTVNLPVGASVTYTASANISPSASGNLVNTATVSVPVTMLDPTPLNNSATDTDTLAASADLAITKTDGVTTATPGGSVTYTITASNAGPSDVTGATVADTFPASLTVNWTCVGAGGGTCTAGPTSGNINDTVNLPAGGSVTYTATANISPAATGTLSNTATIAAPGGVTDPNPANNSALDMDTLTPQADLSITKTDGVTVVIPGGSTTYTIVASNSGPSNTSATVSDTFPASLTASWTCVGAGGGTCTAGPVSGNINDSVSLPAGGSVTYTVSANISGAASGTISNTATVSGVATDPVPGNNSATDNDNVVPPVNVTINQKTSAPAQADPSNGPTINFTVVFASSVTGFNSASDVTLSGTAGATTAVITGSGTTYNVAVSGMTTDGTVIVDVPAGVATGTLGQPNAASTSTDNTVDYDGTEPDTIIDAPTPNNPTNATTANLAFHGTDSGSGVDPAGYECQLDGGGFSGCSSVRSYSSLADGSHTFQVRSKDVAGNVDSTPASFTWVVDTVAPDTIIDTNPTNPSNSATGAFTFHGVPGTGSAIGSAECKLDSGSFAACDTITSHTLTGLSEGSHTFSVRAIDAAGNTDLSAATYTWTVDTVEPTTSISANPANPTASSNASFTFSGADTGGTGVASFQCQIDGGSYSTCTSPKSYLGLADGSHTFNVRAVDNAGNMDSTPASFTWVIDATAPNTTIDPTPPSNPTNSTSATFNFSGDDGTGVGGLTFECKLDSGSFASCTSPKNYSSLSTGSHTFLVRAKDSLGNTDPTPASHTWVIDTTVPTVVVSSTTTSPTNISPITVTITFSEVVTGFTPTTASGDIVIGGVGGTDSTPTGGGTTYSFQLTPSGQGAVTVTVPAGSAQDLATNPNTVSNTFSITYDTVAPSVTINQAGTQSDPTSLSPINYTVVFNEAINVSSFTGADVTLGGTAGATTAVVTQIAPMNGTTFNVAVSGMTVSGTVTASITANKVTDAAGNNNTASSSTDNSVTFDATPLTVTINQAATQTDPDFADSATKKIHFTAVFSEPVTGFAGSDISFAGTTLMGTLSATVTQIAPMDGTTYDVAVKGMLPKGTVFVSIPANSATSIARLVGNQASTSTDNNIIVDYVLVEFTSTGSKDGWVLESTETSGVGGSLDSTATTSKVGDDASDRQYRSILDFATGSLPDSAVFFSVNLRVIEHSITGTNPFTTHGLLKLEIKDGFFGTASALQNPDFESAPDKSACNFETVPEILESIGTAYRCIFFESSYPYINVTGSTQFKLRFANDDNDDLSADIFNFYSGDYGGLTQRPRLFIKYYIPPAP